MAGSINIAEDEYKDNGICWHCGQVDAPLHEISLSKVEFPMLLFMILFPPLILLAPLIQDTFISQKRMKAPLCDSHGNANNLIRYLRMVYIPVSVLVLVVLFNICMHMEVFIGPFILFAPILLSIIVFVVLRSILSRYQSFWVHQINVRTVDMCFNDKNRLEMIARELNKNIGT